MRIGDRGGRSRDRPARAHKRPGWVEEQRVQTGRRPHRRGGGRAAGQRVGLPAGRPARALRRGRLHIRGPGPPLRAGLRRHGDRTRPLAAAAPSATRRSRTRIGDQRRTADSVSRCPLRGPPGVTSIPSERLVLGSEDPTLEAIEWLTPLGRGSRVVIVGAAHAGKTETLRSLLATVAGRADLELTLVLTGARPEEIAQWREGQVAPVAALTFAASADAQGQAVERALGCRQAGGSPRLRERARPDRRPRRPATARRPQGARRRAQPA